MLSVFGLAPRAALERLAGAVLQGDVPLLLETVEGLDAGGKDLQRVVLELLDHFRNLLVVLYTDAQTGALDLTPPQRQVLSGQAAGTDAARVQRIADILIDSEGRMRYALSKRTLLEMALIRSARAATTVTIDAVLRGLNSLKAGLGQEAPVPPGAPPAPPRAAPAAPATPAPGKPDPVPPAAAKAPAEDGAALLNARWAELTGLLCKAMPRLRPALHDAKAVRVEGGEVEIGVDPEFAAAREELAGGRQAAALEREVGRMLGRAVRVTVTLLPARSRLPADHPVPPPEDAASAPAPEPAGPGAPPDPAPNLRKELLATKSVQRVLDLFDGMLVDIRV